ncbi:hypothetical protein GLOTRDRAFT_91289 [Gloeophyllum trabeum ATCC 11539]|uniref:Uncharacterized protein n=1 Tax=Gloeophyllum trabeum (strain ATCC 11539 / FP-39264 / Madison 617) TaxID=670483 RepID=S7QJG2_GLOTA|nr:uncharacterized protein GLOTRDRAFT_91289 [Gloeophyllum trabeum ATCC 11539]EPQ59811.1 hypothetical protein GLOTRDRAFT_91289 [Gloeophyllum trabeum ATCC 11539]
MVLVLRNIGSHASIELPTSTPGTSCDGEVGCIYATSGLRREQGQLEAATVHKTPTSLDAAILEKVKAASGSMSMTGIGREMIPTRIERCLNAPTHSHWDAHPNVNVPSSPTIAELDARDSFPLLCILSASLSEDKVPEPEPLPVPPTSAVVAAPTPTRPVATPSMWRMADRPPPLSLSRTSSSGTASITSSGPVTPMDPNPPGPHVLHVATPGSSIPLHSSKSPMPSATPVVNPNLKTNPPAPPKPKPLPATLAPSPSRPLSLKAQQSLAQSRIDTILSATLDAYDVAQAHIDEVLRKYEARRQEGLVRLAAARVRSKDVGCTCAVPTCSDSEEVGRQRREPNHATPGNGSALLPGYRPIMYIKMQGKGSGSSR